MRGASKQLSGGQMVPTGPYIIQGPSSPTLPPFTPPQQPPGGLLPTVNPSVVQTPVLRANYVQAQTTAQVPPAQRPPVGPSQTGAPVNTARNLGAQPSRAPAGRG